MRWIKWIMGMMVWMLVFAGAQAESPMEAQLKSVLVSDHRTPAFVARDVYRHPLQTLQFFDVQPDMTVVEIWPGGGWYAEILAPYLKEKGVYYSAGFSLTANRTPEWRKNFEQRLRDKFAADSEHFGAVRLSGLSVPEDTEIAPPHSADRVLTFRNVHNWLKGDYAEGVFEAMYRALKPGGILGVVEHRAKPGTSLEQMKESGYVTEAKVVELAEQAGFKLLERSEVNANPKDTADHPKGVWTLPPTLRLKDVDRDKYLAIGESDRMTLKFIKPE